ncbi:hypothetical protein AMTR_s00069p00153770 [Amborella trichopoda]|uniref:Uncharacterized protein n=1 Tax=Amborella trichopoda TaxID=13333 RepID=U5DA65_AMBTC|nr:hypothetical protein AMTR_s00069p00153770 [Amborella trichopoda]
METYGESDDLENPLQFQRYLERRIGSLLQTYSKLAVCIPLKANRLGGLDTPLSLYGCHHSGHALNDLIKKHSQLLRMLGITPHILNQNVLWWYGKMDLKLTSHIGSVFLVVWEDGSEVDFSYRKSVTTRAELLSAAIAFEFWSRFCH